MALDELELLFDEEDLDIDAPTSEQLYKMYGCFLNDFHKNLLVHKGRTVTFNMTPSKHPLFKKKFQGFVHVVTRKNHYSGRRDYDRQRANRIHWIKPILENWKSPFVSYFERVNDDGLLQYYYWVQELDFLVILREVNPDLLLVTSFCVDNDNIGQFRKYLNEYRNGI